MFQKLLRHLRPRPLVVVLPVTPEIDVTSPQFREAARAWLNDPTTKLMLATAEYHCRPTVFAMAGDEVKRLHVIQGWEWFRNALLSIDQLGEGSKEPTESFSDPNHFRD